MLVEIIIYQTENGKEPFYDWLDTLEENIEERIQSRINRLKLGNLGDYKSLGNGILELRLDFGSGYRIYFGFDGFRIIVLLCGGDKKTQTKDIKKAQQYWRNYNEKNK